MHEILWQQGAVDSLIEFLSSEHKVLQKVAVGALFGLLDYGISLALLLYILAHFDRFHLLWLFMSVIIYSSFLDSNKGAHLTTRNKSIISLLIDATQQYPSWSFRLAKIGCLLSLAKHGIEPYSFFQDALSNLVFLVAFIIYWLYLIVS